MEIRMAPSIRVTLGSRTMDQVPLLIIDPNQLFREGLHTILSHTEFDVIHGTADIGEGLEFVKTNDGIKMVILDFSDDGSDGALQILKQMRAANEDAKLIVLTNEMSVRLLTRVLSAGADAYLLKSLSSEVAFAIPPSRRSRREGVSDPIGASHCERTSWPCHAGGTHIVGEGSFEG